MNQELEEAAQMELPEDENEAFWLQRVCVINQLSFQLIFYISFLSKLYHTYLCFVHYIMSRIFTYQ